MKLRRLALMKIFLSVIALVALSLCAHAQILQGIMSSGTNGPPLPTIVQSGTCDTSASSNCTFTFGVAITAGNYIVCYSAGTGNTTGVSCTMTGETITRQTGAAGCSNNAGLEADCYLV